MNFLAEIQATRHNSVDSVPTSNLVCIKEVAIRTNFSHMINIAGIIYYACRLVIDIQYTHYKMPLTNVINEMCVKIPLLKILTGYVMRYTSGLVSI